MADLGDSRYGLKLLSRDLFGPLLDKAVSSDRGRTNLNFHESLSENLHRFLNVMTRYTYFTPHRHLKPPKAESFLVLQGKIAVLIFSEEGKVLEYHILEALNCSDDVNSFGVDLAAGCWHTIICLSDTAICYEVKPGPYDLSDDKEFAPWAPHEGDLGCIEYQQSLLDQMGICL